MSVLRTRVLAIGAGALVLVIVAGVAGYLLFIRGDAPPPVTLAGAVASLASATPAATPAVGASAAPGASTAPAAADQPASLVGEWRIASDAQSFVGYRVVEELANFGTNTAVGRTPNVTGSLRFDGTAVTVVRIEADLRNLRSDDSRRDNAVSRRALETSTFPTATFNLTQPIAIADEPTEGETVEVTALGQLTLHGVTRDVSLPLSGTLTAGRAVVVGSVEIVFTDYAIEAPRAPLVLSIEDQAVIEFQLVFEPAS